MITKLILENFKSVERQTYDFTSFDLLVGRNNSGKSTVLQALAIWQFCVDEFDRSKRSGSAAMQLVLPNFTAVPVPEFNLLWKDRKGFRSVQRAGESARESILIGIGVEWKTADGQHGALAVNLRYQTPQTVYASPVGGWFNFRLLAEGKGLPRIAYVPPFSGLEVSEKKLDDAPIRQQVGKGQPGSVLRNLLLKACPPVPLKASGERKGRTVLPADWTTLAQVVEKWFSVELISPAYDAARDVHIECNYRQGGKIYDLIAGGSGFHQTLTLLAFLYGYQPTTILLDEPDAHLHVNLQRAVLNFFLEKSQERGTQFLIATHAEEFVRGVSAQRVVSLLSREPKRIEDEGKIIRALGEVSNEEVTELLASPYILYVEGESDRRILQAWGLQCRGQEALSKVYIKTMGGGGKANMNSEADKHFDALRQMVPQAKRLMLFDFDSVEEAFHPSAGNPALAEWKRRNIENYLLVPEAWKRAAAQATGREMADAQSAISDFFEGENLTLPRGREWRTLAADIFKQVDGKKILFEADTSLFQKLRQLPQPISLLREVVALQMTADEIHEDVHDFFGKLKRMTDSS